MWASTYTGCRTNTGCLERVSAVLEDVDVRGWDVIRPTCEKELSEARVLAKDAEALVHSVSNLDGPCSDQIKAECIRLLCRTQLWVTAEEELISLMDQGADVVDQALGEAKLVWQGGTPPVVVQH